MSSDTHSTHTHGTDAGAHGAAPHGSLKGYLTGFGLSVLLTALPFWLVMSGAPAGPARTGLLIAALAMVQIVVHIIFFLHMSPRSEGGWNMMAMAFTVIIVIIAVAGSVWIMQHLNANMTPDMDMSNQP